jgi:diketogulonate reductase-like aldo/keto reductase
MNLTNGKLDTRPATALRSPASGLRSRTNFLAAVHSAGKTKSIAVSNFSPEQFDCIVKNKTGTQTIPAVNQMSFSVGSGAGTVVADNKARGGVLVQAYSPLRGGALANDPDCAAIGKTHNKTAAQVAFRWIVQRGATFTSSALTVEYFQQDLDIFDFSLTDSEMKQLNSKH